MSAARSCSAEGCNAPSHCRGLCQPHYDRLRRTPGFVPYRPPHTLLGRTTLERLRLNFTVDPESLCWRWTAGHRPDGYGLLSHRQVHRVAYELWVGPIPDGLHIDHVRSRGCIHRDCINPYHLEPVTLEENNRRRDLYRIVPPECGTTSGYHAHRKRGEATCGPCRRAWADYVKSRRTAA